jgi:DNA-directed RNA polymerase subunit RPC12/RpoP
MTTSNENRAKATSEPQLLDSGNYQDVCSDCGTTTVGATPEDVLGAACACQARRTYRYLVELVCTLCSRQVGTAVVDQPQAPIRVPRQLRCSHCGGQPVAGEAVRQVVYPSVPREPARRGRPPRWLLDQRRLERNAS